MKRLQYDEESGADETKLPGQKAMRMASTGLLATGGL